MKINFFCPACGHAVASVHDGILRSDECAEADGTVFLAHMVEDGFTIEIPPELHDRRFGVDDTSAAEAAEAAELEVERQIALDYASGNDTEAGTRGRMDRKEGEFSEPE